MTPRAVRWARVKSLGSSGRYPSKSISAGYIVYRGQQCDDSKADREGYSEGGQIVVKCDLCTAERQACDGCTLAVVS